jgi:hypothetical protein
MWRVSRAAGLRPSSLSRRGVRAVSGLIPAALATFILLGSAAPAGSQELEPRVYSAAPVNTNFVVGTWSNSKGSVPLNPSLPLTDVHGSINTLSLSFTHTFPFEGRTATWAVAVPYVGGHITGSVYSLTPSNYALRLSRSGLAFFSRPFKPRALPFRVRAAQAENDARSRRHGHRSDGNVRPDAIDQRRRQPVGVQTRSRPRGAAGKMVRRFCGGPVVLRRKRRFLERAGACAGAAWRLSGSYRI